MYELSDKNDIDLSYKILIKDSFKDSDKNLKLKSVRFEILSQYNNSIYFELNLKTEKEKVILLKTSATNVLDFKYEKNLTVGINQYYNFECEISKNEDTIAVDNLILRFNIGDENNREANISKSVVSLGSSNYII